MTAYPTLQLKGFDFVELFHSSGLNRLDEDFLCALKEQNTLLHEQLMAYRDPSSRLSPIEISELLISCATFLEHYLARLFNIENALSISQLKTTEHNPIAIFKKYFVLKRAKKELSRVDSLPEFNELHAWLQKALASAPLQSKDMELAVALLGNTYLHQPDTYTIEIEKLVQWCTRALSSSEGLTIVGNWTSFHLPKRIDHFNLITTNLSESAWRLRDGFKLTDERMSAREVQDEVNYCIYCHDHEGDFCSKGFPVKKGDPSQGFKKNPLEVTLTGCPLEEKISEMHYLKKDGHTLASLAMVMIDNPMCPATGHRICNDCMKACIYQKQDPVNIPQIETRVLMDVLTLPWGVEIYDLLTRWNPLRRTQWVMKPYNGLKIMIAGMGPAGFTLAHHLLLEGFAVLGFDGLKIEPLPDTLIKQPIYRYDDLKEALDERIMAGFGGVAEYGITVRWDKNFLKLIYLSLMRKPYFQVFGAVRFGGTIKIEDAWEMGFDHFVLAVGAGLPKALPISGSLAPGMRQANDFLMALQLGNAAKSSSLTNLQVRLPAVIIGGGLTGVDTATEVQAYYITQVEKIKKRYEELVKQQGEAAVLAQLDDASREILDEFLQHAAAIQEERARAKAKNRSPNFIKLIRDWGGVTIAYRRSKQESPAYVHNHEELQNAIQEGIYYLEGVEPTAVTLDQHGHAAALVCYKRVRDEHQQWLTTNEEITLAARSILVATGTQPNTAYEFEHRGTFNRLKLEYLHYEDDDGELSEASSITHCKHPHFGPFTSYQKQDKRVSLIGDTHPVFHGSVVKAITSGMRTYPKILKLLQDKLQQRGHEDEYQVFANNMRHLFTARVTTICRKHSETIELTVQAPLAAKHFQPGQFYRLQNFETHAPCIHDTLLQIEPLALVAAECSKLDGTLTFIIHEHSVAAKLCALLKPGEPVALMGPTGVRAKIPDTEETILIIGNQSSFAFLRSYAASLYQAGHRVLYAGLFAKKEEVYCQAQIEACTHAAIWVTQKGEAIATHRATDYAVTEKNIIDALIDYNEKSASSIRLQEVDRIFIIGDTTLLKQFQAARQAKLKNYLSKDPKVVGSVYSNMQCMLKGVCAQCLQWQVDPKTGQRTKAVFACSWQDQPLEIIDIDHMHARQLQNRLHEKMSHLWVDYLFKHHEVMRV